MSEFEPGQTWQYETRPGEGASRLVVCKVETDPKLGTIVHIHVEGVAIKNPRASGGTNRILPHLPLSAAALRKSVVARGPTREELPAYAEGYDTWRQSFDAGKAGVFSVSVAESLDFLEQALAR